MTKPTRWDRDEWDAATMALLRRSGGRCEVCGGDLRNAGVRHHRQRRRTGGDRLSNLILIHQSPCHQKVHDHPEWARSNGFIISAYEPNIDTVPIAIREAWWTLHDDGTRRPVP